MATTNCFLERRQYLLKKMDGKSIAIIFATKEPRHHRKTVYPYRQDSTFYYLTGLNESEAIAVFVPNRKEGEYILFCLEKNPEEEVWTGSRIGQEKACEEYGANQAFSLSMVESMLPTLISGHEKIYFNLGDHEDHELIMHWVNELTFKGRTGVNNPTDLVDIGKITNEMRLYKDEEELAFMRKAADITCAAQVMAAKACRPQALEYEIEAEIMREFYRNGGRSPSFEPIVASGKNTCTLHYSQNNAVIKDGDLLLVDIGVEYQHYAADVTRTYPISGHFSPEQRVIYQAVLDTQLAVIEHVRPGIEWIELHHLSEQLITKKLIALGLLHGRFDDLLAQQSFKPFYMHYIGHWLGLDVKDPGSYKTGENWRILEPGMVFTVEPGIYISENMPNIDKKWWNIGVRIEDDVLVTKNGHEVLSKAPKSIDEIEALMRK